MKFPYGITDFKKIVTEDYFYCDRTDKIPLLEQAESQLFIRPRRFGKSLLLSMLEHYYDVGRKDEFEKIFGNLAIGQHPTEDRNSYFILRWDFSCVDAFGTVKEIKRSLFNHINGCIEGFHQYYTHKGFELPKPTIDVDDAFHSLKSLSSAMRVSGHPVYLLIDEYDNFANTIMMQARANRERYDALVHDEGILKTLFKAVKASTSSTMFDRVFITGVSPVVLSDITSGYNIAENVYFSKKFNDLCGFRESEVRQALNNLAKGCGRKTELAEQAAMLTKTYYDGYRFCLGEVENVYNPTLCLYFFKQFQEECEFPFEMLDDNLAVDESKLEYIAQLPQGKDIILQVSQKGQKVIVGKINKRFGLQDMLSDTSKDQTFLASYLYYFGVLTLGGISDTGKFILQVPNLVMQSLYVERVQRMLLPDPGTRDQGTQAAELAYQQGDIAPLCAFVQDTYLKVFKNRDYRWANELTLKTAFITLLYNDILFIMDSEPELDRRYADLTMIIRPDKRHFKLFDLLMEFKFITLPDLGLNAEKVRDLDLNDLLNLSPVKKAFADAEKQILEYGTVLEDRHGDLRLQKFSIVSLGFERVLWRKID